MRTLALTVAYDGTDWAGFQRQTRYPSVQGALETALSQVLQHPVEIAAAGRTDAGVHALGQVVSLRTGNPLPIGRLPWVVNRALPPSIRIMRAAEMPAGFHARWSARWRRYWYLVQTSGRPDPIRGRFSWQLGRPLDVAAMREALGPLVGRHDFGAFCHGGAPVGSTVRAIRRAEVRRRPGTIVVDVQADAFLHQMVRLLVANLVLVGMGECPVSWMAELLASRNRHLAGKGAPACGLFLMRVGYGPKTDCPPGGGYVGETDDEELSGKTAGS